MSRNFKRQRLGDTVQISGVCTVTNEEYIVRVPAEDYDEWQGGAYIQKVFPLLTSGQREFIKTGMTPDEWSKTFPPEAKDG